MVAADVFHSSILVTSPKEVDLCWPTVSQEKRRDRLRCVIEIGGVHLADGLDDKGALHISSTWDIPYTPDYTEHWKLRTSEPAHHRSQLTVMFHVARNCGHHGWSERTALTAMCAGLVQSQNYAGGC